MASETASLTRNADLEALTQAMENQCNMQGIACDEATVRHSDDAELCAARTEVYELARYEHTTWHAPLMANATQLRWVSTLLCRLNVQVEMATVTQE